MRLRGIVLETTEIREVPKHALTLDEVNFALGAESLVKQLRDVGALVPARREGRTLLFDAGDVARCWAEYKAGKFDRLIAALR